MSHAETITRLTSLVDNLPNFFFSPEWDALRLAIRAVEQAHEAECEAAETAQLEAQEAQWEDRELTLRYDSADRHCYA